MYRTVGDQEHTDIINGYLDERLSMGKLAEKLNRSAATIPAQIQAHNRSIDKLGYCQECRRLKGKHETQKAEGRTTDQAGPLKDAPGTNPG